MNLRSVNIFKPIGRTYEPAATAWQTTVDNLKPLMDRAKAEKLFFRNKYSGKILTPAALAKQLRQRQFVQGSNHWHLIDAQGRRVA